MDAGLDGKIVLITGAAKGIGRATALAFAREGARLALLDIDAEGLASLKSEVEVLGTEATFAPTDLSTGSGIDAGIDAVLGGTAARSISWSTMSARGRSARSTSCRMTTGTRRCNSTS